MTIKEKFEHLEERPNPQVWEQIERTMVRRARIRKGVVWSTVAVAVLAVAGVWVGHRDHTEQEIITSSAFVAANRQESQESPIVATPTEQAKAPSVSAQQEDPYVHNLKVLDEPISKPVQREEQRAVSTISLESKEVAVIEPKKQETNKVAEVQKPIEQENVATNSEETEKASAPSHPSADELAIWIPNAFIPNEPNNEVNGKFKVVAKQGADIQKFKMFIYSRAGGMVFKSTNIEQGWDGTTNGELQPTGAYVYVIEYYDGQKEKMETVRGMVTLVR